MKGTELTKELFSYGERAVFNYLIEEQIEQTADYESKYLFQIIVATTYAYEVHM
jgi:hypothetical protein